MATAASIAEVQQAYVAYYGRPADPEGLDYWADRVDSEGGIENLISSFGNSAEASARFGSLSSDAAIEAIYQQIFGRAAEAEGKAFYLSGLLSGQFTLVSLARDIAGGATGTDAVVLANKLSVAQAFTDAIDTDSEQALYSGNTAAANARTWLDSVDSTSASATAATSSLDETIQSLQGETNTSTFSLTTSEDSPVLTTGNDLITGTTSTLSADDRILDSSTSDNDVLNLTLSSDPPALDVTNIESINIDWDGFGTPDVDLDNVTNATVTVSSTKSGYLGNANFTNVGTNAVATGVGVTRTVTVDAIEDSTITASNASTLTVTNAEGDMVVNAAAATAVTIANPDSVEITAPNAAAISVTGGNAETVALNVASDMALTLTVDADADVTVTNTSAEDIGVTVAEGATLDTLTGVGGLDVTFESTADATGATISGFGDVSFDKIAATADLTLVAAETITFNAETDSDLATGINLVFANNATVVLDAAINQTSEIADFLTSAELDGSADTINIISNVDDLEGQFNFAEGEVAFETVNLTFTAADAEDLAQVEGLTAAAGGAINLISAEFDVTVDTIDANEINASGVAGALTLSDVTNGDAEASGVTVVSGSGDNTIDFNAELGALEVVLIADADGETTVTLAGGEAYAQEGEGSLTIMNSGDGGVTLTAGAEDVLDGTVLLASGAGDDSFTAESGSTLGGAFELTLGDGENTLTLNGALGDVAFTAGMGSGDDTLEIGAEFGDNAEATLDIDLGDGTNTLVLASAIAEADVSISGVDIIELGSSTEDSIAVGMLDSLIFTVTGAGYDTYTDAEALLGEAEDTYDVMLNHLDMTAEGSTDLSGITIDRTVDEALSGISLTVTSEAEDSVTLVGTIHGDEFVLAESAGSDSITIAAGDSVAYTAFTFTNAEGVAAGVTTTLSFLGALGDAEGDGLDAEDVAGGEEVAAAHIFFGNGVDVITGFDVEADTIDFTNVLAPVDLLDAEEAGESVINNLDEDTVFALQGDFDAEANIFSINFDAEGVMTGADVLLFENQDTAAMDSFLTLTNAVVLTGVVTAELDAGHFV